VLALTLALGLGLSMVLVRELKPLAPTQAPPTRSRLVGVLEGVMAANVTPAERERFRAWVASGATREGFVQVEAVVVNNCASCHGPGGQFPRLDRFEDIHPLAMEAVPAGLLGLVDARTLHLVGLPLLILVAVGGYLRRTAWRGRKILMAGCTLAMAFDAAQWWLRQGRPEALWAAWTASAALAAAMAALAAVVLAELWDLRTR
jgi:cytochrome c553/uncharacterized membrane protein (UPF0136 family)